MCSPLVLADMARIDIWNCIFQDIQRIEDITLEVIWDTVIQIVHKYTYYSMQRSAKMRGGREHTFVRCAQFETIYFVASQ